uniref:DENN/MADD domain containing 1B n=1 Tax=Electrophorus electricus TaxID=8005 RepID=A0A4W4H3D6_ELEEL
GFTDIFEEEITEGGFCGSEWHFSVWRWKMKGEKTHATPLPQEVAKVRARKGLWGVKDRIRHKVSSTGLFFTLSHTLTHTHTHSMPKNSVCVCVCDCRISSEDSGEMPSYTEDSDDSYELEPETKEAGQMNLLEEILDSLNTTSIEQGKLSAAKSLDFFRSMDDLDCSLSVTARFIYIYFSVCFRLAASEPSGRNMVQDDSIVHGKHLPPSPRRQCSTRSWSLPQLSQRSSHPDPLLQPPVSEVAKATEPPTQPDSPLDPQPNPDGQRPATCGVLRRKVLSRETLRHFQERSQQGGACPSNRHPSVLVPWEKEQEGHGEGTQEHQEKLGVQEKGLLEEIEAVCRLSMAMNSSLQLAQVHNNAGLDKS